MEAKDIEKEATEIINFYNDLVKKNNSNRITTLDGAFNFIAQQNKVIIQLLRLVLIK